MHGTIAQTKTSWKLGPDSYTQTPVFSDIYHKLQKDADGKKRPQVQLGPCKSSQLTELARNGPRKNPKSPPALATARTLPKCATEAAGAAGVDSGVGIVPPVSAGRLGGLVGSTRRNWRGKFCAASSPHPSCYSTHTTPEFRRRCLIDPRNPSKILSQLARFANF